jgi:hypothetical protein
MSTEPATADDGLTYTYRPSLMAAPWVFRLNEQSLEWSAGRYSGGAPFDKIRRVRMSFRPTNMQQKRFMTEIWADGCPKLPIVSSSWKSVFEQEALDRAYVEFVTELHRRMAQAGATAEFQRGGNPLIVWPGFALFTAVTLGMLWLVLRALQEAEFGGAAFIVAFIALFVWRGWNFFRRNLPGVYRPDALPELLLPKLDGSKP